MDCSFFLYDSFYFICLVKWYLLDFRNWNAVLYIYWILISLIYAAPFSIGFLFYFFKTNKISTANLVILSLVLILFDYFILHANFWQIGFILIACGILFFEKHIWKFLSQLGDISYSLYLTHGLSGGTFLYFTQYRVHSIEAKLSLFIAALGIALLFSMIFYRFIEVPSRKWASSINWR